MAIGGCSACGGVSGEVSARGTIATSGTTRSHIVCSRIVCSRGYHTRLCAAAGRQAAHDRRTVAQAATRNSRRTSTDAAPARQCDSATASVPAHRLARTSRDIPRRARASRPRSPSPAAPPHRPPRQSAAGQGQAEARQCSCAAARPGWATSAPGSRRVICERVCSCVRVRVAACLIAVVEQQAHDDVPREVPELLDHLQHSTHGYSRVLTGTRSAGHRCGQIGPAIA